MTSLIRGFMALIGMVVAAVVFSQDLSLDGPPEDQHYVANIELHTTAELHSVLERAEQLLVEGLAPQSDPATVTFILHGPEVISLLKKNYLQHKETVDLAARLSALGVVEIKACETWMGGNSVLPGDLQPFVGTVSYSPTEVLRLTEEEGYLYF